MKVFIAGATGAIGRPLVERLLAAGHQVIALTRTPDAAHFLTKQGVKTEKADVLDAKALHTAIAHTRPDVVINQLTSLPKQYTPEEMQRATERDRRVKLEGGANLEKAAQEAGVRRYIIQASAFFLAPGSGLADESTPLAVDASPAIAASARLYTEIERRALTGSLPESVVLRYGFFYGPGTWYTPDGSITERVQLQQYPIAGDGHGVWSFIHIEDAAAATMAALECAPGVYNIVDDQPSELYIWLPAFARWVGAPAPPRISAEEALRTFGPDYLYNATRLRGAANAKARSELGFKPRPLEWLATTT